MIVLGDCLEVLKTLPENSVDSIVTDPPYGLSFMGKSWDYDVPTEDIWRECLRVLKPGGHLLAFFGTRTYHRGAIKIEDAGFEIRDQIQWLYGSGFPKSMDISKAIDKQAGAERTETYIREDFAKRSNKTEQRKSQVICGEKGQYSLPATDAAKEWQGWGTAIKPANEPIVVARKPLSEKTVAANVLKHGTGGINVDGCRIEAATPIQPRHLSAPRRDDNTKYGKSNTHINPPSELGRWPANLILDEHAAAMLDEQSGNLKNGGQNKTSHRESWLRQETKPTRFSGDSGGASRFFYVAKASKSERNAGLEGEVKEKQGNRPNSKDSSGKFPDHDHRPTGGNNHPTVKPIKLMTYLVRLVTPPGGTVMDPFMGSGSTGVAAIKEGFKFLGIEKDPTYLEIARARLDFERKISEEKA